MSTGVRRTMKYRKIVTAVLTILACTAVTLAAQKSSPGVFAQNKGKLPIKLDGQTVGREDFEIAPSGAGWRAKGTTDIKPSEGPASKISGTLTLQPDGAPISYEWTAQAEKTNGAHLLFANGGALHLERDFCDAVGEKDVGGVGFFGLPGPFVGG